MLLPLVSGAGKEMKNQAAAATPPYGRKVSGLPTACTRERKVRATARFVPQFSSVAMPRSTSPRNCPPVASMEKPAVLNPANCRMAGAY
jgi:hypothetical protein